MVLNIGCGFAKMPGAVNLDGFEACSPDILHNLNVKPFPFDDNVFDAIYAIHVLEHLDDWWGCLVECSRMLKLGGSIEIRVPDESSNTALCYRDHLHVFSLASFHGIVGTNHGTNAWAASQPRLPLKLEQYQQVPFSKYAWIAKWFPWVMRFLADHMRNFVWEQRFIFRKVQL